MFDGLLDSHYPSSQPVIIVIQIHLRRTFALFNNRCASLIDFLSEMFILISSNIDGSITFNRVTVHAAHHLLIVVVSRVIFLIKHLIVNETATGMPLVHICLWVELSDLER